MSCVVQGLISQQSRRLHRRPNMMGRNERVLDAMAVLSFVIGLANYGENIDQSTLQETATNIITDIHRHLKQQDDKIDRILERLEALNDERQL